MCGRVPVHQPVSQRAILAKSVRVGADDSKLLVCKVGANRILGNVGILNLTLHAVMLVALRVFSLRQKQLDIPPYKLFFKQI